MRKGAKLSLAAGAAFALIGFLWLLAGEREPEYKGHRLSHWLAICRSSEVSQAQRDEAATAVRNIGTNGLPFLMKWASKSPSQVGERLGVFLDQHRIPFIPKSVRVWARTTPDHTRSYEARLGFMILGSEAAPVIPDLVRLGIDSAGRQSASWAISALGDIGPPALAALLTISTNPAASGRAYAVSQIPKLGTNALPALPTLTNLLNDPNAHVSHSSAVAIGDLGLASATSIPVLISCLQRPDSMLRASAAMSLRRFGPDGQVAIPEIRKAISNETNPFTRAVLAAVLHNLERIPATDPRLP